jgi:ATP-dependent Clp endopeptidase proteolytic subunit ClpP
MQKLTIPQQQAFYQNFYTNGTYVPKRTIVLGTDSFKEDATELSVTDFTDLVKSLVILEETRVKPARDPETGEFDEAENLIKITLYTTGGSVYLALGIYDAIKACRSPVEIRAIGECMSAGTIILQAADYRYAYPNTTFMIHKGDVDMGRVSVNDAEIETQEIKRITRKMIDIYVSCMSLGREAIEDLLNKDTFMDANAAKRIGLIDDVKERFD